MSQSGKTLELKTGATCAIGIGAHGTDKTVALVTHEQGQPRSTVHLTSEEAREAGDLLHSIADEVDRAAKTSAA
jgi:hypothetical protein